MDWDFTLANYGPVWSFMVQFGLLLLFLLITVSAQEDF